MAGGRDRRSTLDRARLLLRALAGVLIATVGFACLIIFPDDRAVVVLGAALLLLGFFVVATLVIVGMVRLELDRHTETVNETVDRGMVEVLPPRRVVDRLLERIYGPSSFNDQVATALLGGEGRALDAGDLTISEHTEIDYRLDTIDTRNYQLVMEARYSFRNRIPTSKFVIFATSEPFLRDSIISGCRLPLFELWFVREDAEKPRFEESAEAMRESVNVGIQFADSRGFLHDVPARSPGDWLREVKLRDWGRYLSFFRTDLPEGDGIDRQDYAGKLRIFELDLHAMAESRHKVATIRRLIVRSTTIQLLSDGFCFWQAPYPCFVEKMSFDTTSFTVADHLEMQYSIKPFAISGAEPPAWTTGAGVAQFPVQSWMLPGHGVVFLWRPAAWW